MNNILLSVCIPTYNRREITVKCIETVYRSIKNTPFGEKLVQVVVVDNCSDDGTDKALNQLKGKYPSFEYCINNTNIGFPGNFLRCLELARGDYVWVLGSDDLINLSTIQSIISIINSYNPDGILQSFSFNLEEEANYPIGKWSSGIVSNISALKLFGHHVSFISSIIYKRSFIKVVDPRFTKSEYIGLRLTLQFLSKAQSVYVIREPMLLVGKDEKAYDSYEIICKLLFDVFNVSKKSKELPAGVINKIIGTDLIRNVQGFVVNRKLRGAKTTKQVYGLLSRYYSFWRYWLIIIPLSILPSNLILTLKKTNKIISRNRSI